jgi:hypothetical protein
MSLLRLRAFSVLAKRGITSCTAPDADTRAAGTRANVVVDEQRVAQDPDL